MKSTYSIFVIGAILATPIPLIDDLIDLEEFSKNPSYLLAVQTGANVWLFSYLIILAVVILIRIIPSLNTRLSKNQLLALNFLSGQSFGFVIIRLLTFSF
jgi:hypothetical protein